MLPEKIEYDKPFEVNAAQLTMMQRFFGQQFAWRMDGTKILIKVWIVSSGERMLKALKKLE